MHRHDASCFVHTFPPFRSVRWYACHACLCHPLAFYASLHACLHGHAWVLLVSVSSILQHNEVMGIRSKLTFVPHGHHVLFTFLLVCLLACLLAFLLFACHVYCAYLFYTSFICSFHLFLPLLVYWFLVFAFTCTYMEKGRMELGHGLPSASKKGRGCEHVDISQTAVFNRFRGLASPIWLCTLLNPLPSSPISLLDGLY